LLGAGFAKIARPKLREEETALSHVERLGFKREDVRHIVPTHLDLDHAGGLPDFPQAVVHAFAPEVHAMEAGATLAERNRYRKHQFAHRPHWQRYQVQGERFFGLESVRELKGLPPEILLVPTVGHSRGHVAVVVDHGAELLVHAGDAYFNHAEIYGNHRDCPWQLRAFQRLAASDNRARLRNQERLRALASEPRVKMFCAHDAAEAWELGVR
jgi:glyoxylase-like metal-dependent hydrolase (beta-lactamase superfamily II)